MRALKFLFFAALILFVVVPGLFVLFVTGLAMFGVVFGLGLAMVGMLIFVVKVALMIILPIAILVWLIRR